MTTLTKVVFDDTDSAMSYDSSWTQIRTVTPWSSEFSATAHRADNSGATGTFTYSGATMMVIGTLDSPATYGYPSVTYILDDGEPVTLDLSTTISKYINTTGVTTGVVLYTSGPKPEGAHTVKWTVNNVSPSGPRFYLDAFWVFRQTISSTDPLYYTVYDTRSGFQYGPNARDSGIMGGYTGTDASGEPSIQSFSYTFEGTGISVYGTLYPDQNPPVQVQVQLDNRQKSLTIPTTSRVIKDAVIYQIDGLNQGQHTIAVYTQSPSYWKFDYLMVQTNGIPSPNFFYSSSDGDVSSSPGSEVGTVIPDPNSTTAPQSVFISYGVSSNSVVPQTTYTVSKAQATGTSSSSASGGGGEHGTNGGQEGQSTLTTKDMESAQGEQSAQAGQNAQSGQGSKGGAPTTAIIGAVLGGIAILILFLFLFWLHCRRRRRCAGLWEEAEMEIKLAQRMESTEAILVHPLSIHAPERNEEGPHDGDQEDRRDRRSRKLLQDALGVGTTGTTPLLISEGARSQHRGDVVPSRTATSSEDTTFESALVDTPETDASTISLAPAPAPIPIAIPSRTRTGPESTLILGREDTPREGQWRRRRIIRESDGGVRLDAADDEDGDGGSVVVLPPSYESHRRNAPNAS